MTISGYLGYTILNIGVGIIVGWMLFITRRLISDIIRNQCLGYCRNMSLAAIIGGATAISFAGAILTALTVAMIMFATKSWLFGFVSAIVMATSATIFTLLSTTLLKRRQKKSSLQRRLF